MLRLALRRMDAWFSPQLAREAGRMWFEYEPYHPQSIAYNRLLEPIASGEVLVPSPLLSFSDSIFTLHFQWRAGTGFTSPQVPTEAMLAQGSIGCAPVPPHPAQGEALQRWSRRIDPSKVLGRLERTEGEILASSPEPQQLTQAPVQVWSGQASVADLEAKRQAQMKASNRTKIASTEIDPADLKGRLDTLNAAQRAYSNDYVEQTVQTSDAGPRSSVEAGPLVPMWIDEANGFFVLARRVRVGSESVLQGVVVDWPKLQSELLQVVKDDVPEATLLPVDEESTDPARLITIPARLVVPATLATFEDDRPAHPAAAGLVLVWIAALSAIGVTGLALRSSIGNAARTSRFASSVTHELRTPLTTFRLYSEMLADGMVQDPARQAEYLATLRDESARLGLLVENVLAWSRAEDGRAPAEPRPVTVAALVAEVTPVLQRRCDEAGGALRTSIESDGAATVTTDPDRVRQILFNLVDNACKYAGSNPDVCLVATNGDRRVVLAIEDNGPGIPERLRGRIFRAFDRGDRGPGDSVRGLGLGLAISNELARSLGGRIRCERADGGGARFALELPLAAPA